MHPLFRRLTPYRICILFSILLAIFSLIVSPLDTLLPGLIQIYTTQDLLVSDYIAIGGLGAACLNASICGSLALLLVVGSKTEPNGALIMCFWLVTGFAFFGKTPLNTFPIIVGIWIYSKFQKEPFSNFALTALLCSTLGPLVSEVAHLGIFPLWIHLLISFAVGIAIGFLMPIISSATTRVHGGYDLYNAGFAGGIIAMMYVALSNYLGIEYTRPFLWSEGNNLPLAILLYLISLALIALGFVSHQKTSLSLQYKRILKHSGRLVSDYYLLYGESAYFNMGLLGILSTTITLVLGAPLNGGTLAGIFTIIGFGAFGKHLRNCAPVMLGAILGSLISPQPIVAPVNILAILFCTGLAPIAGQYGWLWGIVAGFVHTTVVEHIGQSTEGLNLYNNGFVAGFVALVLVPIILTFKRGSGLREDEI